MSSSTTFPVEPVGFQSELDLPDLSPTQCLAMFEIKEHGGIYHRHVGGSWYPPNRIAETTRQTDRTIKGLVAKCWLTVTQELHGKPVKVRLTFP